MLAVARRIAAVRSERGVTQERLAERLGIALQNAQRIESGRQNLTLGTIAKVADALGVSPYALVPHATPGAPSATSGFAAPFTRVAGPSKHAVPLMSLRAAAGRFGQGEVVELLDWVVPRARHRRLDGTFVAKVEGASMAPGIPSGAWVLFRAPVLGPPQGRVVLVQARGFEDAETGGSYAVKRVGRVTTRGGRTRVQLVSDNPAFATVTVEVEDASQLRWVAEVLGVLGDEEA